MFSTKGDLSRTEAQAGLLIAENVASVQIPSVINFGKNEDVISMKSGWNIGGTYPRNGSKNVTQSKKVQFAVFGRIPKSKTFPSHIPPAEVKSFTNAFAQ